MRGEGCDHGLVSCPVCNISNVDLRRLLLIIKSVTVETEEPFYMSEAEKGDHCEVREARKAAIAECLQILNNCAEKRGDSYAYMLAKKELEGLK
jgi:hypothetical protein